MVECKTQDQKIVEEHLRKMIARNCSVAQPKRKSVFQEACHLPATATNCNQKPTYQQCNVLYM